MRGTFEGTMLAPESRMAHRLMVTASVDIVMRRTEAASA